MTRMAVNSTALGIILSIVFAFAVFLSRVMFEDARADTRSIKDDLKAHSAMQNEVISDLKRKDAVTEQRFVAVESKLDEVRNDVKELLRRSK